MSAAPANTVSRVRGRIAAAVALMALMAPAQRRLGPPQAREDWQFERSAEFHFVRLEYTDLPQYHRRFSFASRGGRGEGWWLMDWPDADNHFTAGIQRLTRIHTGAPEHFRIGDRQFFDHPWIYATHVGWWGLSEDEVRLLREYLLRGGFLVVDDFWGAEQWEVFRQTMRRVLPESDMTEISESDAIMHVLYDIRDKDRTIIPGTRHLRPGPGGGVTVQYPPGAEPSWHALADGRGRIVVAVNFNTDIGDAWEYADAPEYPEAMTTLAYRYGINYIIYAMTH
jgi:hypothetical protein